eukprot:COSAG06_NODE_2520_length_6728_cov_2.725449_6_plen_113_part_00
MFCPEPVLAKISRLYINGSKRPFSRTALIRAVFAAKAKVALDREQAAAAHGQHDEPTRGGADGALQENASPFLSFSLCLSRACLGKMIIFSIKWHRRGVFLPRALRSRGSVQ